MDINQEALLDITVEGEGRSCFLTYIKLILIPFLTYLVVLLGYFEVLAFPVELHSVVLIGIIFLISLLFARHNAEYGYCQFQQMMGDFRGSLKQYIIKNLMSIGKETKSNASYEDFINHFTKDVRNENYASVGAGIFPTLGILGTFISIAVSMPDFSSQTADALEHEISLLLAGVGTAFYVSIYGIFLSLWWIFFEKRGMSRFERQVESLRRATSSFFWTKEEIEQSYLKENLKHFEKIGHMFETITAKQFLEELNESVKAKFEVFDEMLKLESQAVRMGAEHIKEGMEVLSKSQAEQRDLGRIHGSILQNLEAFNKGLYELQVKFSEERQRSQEKEEVFASQMDLAVQTLRSNATAYVKAQQELAQSLTHWKEETIAAFGETVDEKMHALAEESLKLKDDEEEQSNDELQELKKNLQAIDSETSQIIQKMDALK